MWTDPHIKGRLEFVRHHTHTNESCPMYERVMSHRYKTDLHIKGRLEFVRCHTRTNESCPTYERVMSDPGPHIEERLGFVRHHIHTNNSCHADVWQTHTSKDESSSCDVSHLCPALLWAHSFLRSPC